MTRLETSFGKIKNTTKINRKGLGISIVFQVQLGVFCESMMMFMVVLFVKRRKRKLLVWFFTVAMVQQIK